MIFFVLSLWGYLWLSGDIRHTKILFFIIAHSCSMDFWMVKILQVVGQKREKSFTREERTEEYGHLDPPPLNEGHFSSFSIQTRLSYKPSQRHSRTIVRFITTANLMNLISYFTGLKWSGSLILIPLFFSRGVCGGIQHLDFEYILHNQK